MWNEDLKDKLISEMQQSVDNDGLVQKKYYDSKTGKGCFYGVLLNASSCKDLIEKSREIGIPYEIIALTERIFDFLPVDNFKSFPIEFLEKLPVNKDLNKVVKSIKTEFLKHSFIGTMNSTLEKLFYYSNLSALEAKNILFKVMKRYNKYGGL